jgi:hypothetical protein
VGRERERWPLLLPRGGAPLEVNNGSLPEHKEEAARTTGSPCTAAVMDTVPDRRAMEEGGRVVLLHLSLGCALETSTAKASPARSRP